MLSCMPLLIRFSHQMIEFTVTGMGYVSSIHLPCLPLNASNRVFSWQRFHQVYGVDHLVPRDQAGDIQSSRGGS